MWGRMDFFQGWLGNLQKMLPVTVATDSQIIEKFNL